MIIKHPSKQKQSLLVNSIMKEFLQNQKNYILAKNKTYGR